MYIKSSRLLYFGIVLLFVMMTVGFSSAAEVNVEFVSHVGGTVSDVVIVGDYGYIGQGQDLVVLDIRDTANPLEVGRLNIPSYITDIDVSDKYACLVDGYGLTIVDISNPSSPKLMGKCDIDASGYAYGVAVSDKYAYVVDGYGLVIVDITDPASPKIASRYDIDVYGDGYPAGRDVDVSGKYAYVAGDDGCPVVGILDITDPYSPTLVSSYGLSSDLGVGITISGKYAYVGLGFPGLEILDISNPTSPRYVGAYGEFGPADFTTQVAIEGNYAYIPKESGLEILNISNPSSPIIAGSYATTNPATSIAVSGDNVYLAAGNSGLLILRTELQDQIKAGQGAAFEIIKPGAIFEGPFDDYDFGTYPMRMEVTGVDGNEFSGILHWPTLRDSKTKFRGTIDSEQNKVWFTEYELIQGSNIVLNGNYYAELTGSTLSGYWNLPSGRTRGTFSISLKDDASAIKVGQGAATPEIEQLFINEYTISGGSSLLGNPATIVHEAFGFQVQDFPGASGIPGGVIMYNPSKNNAYYIHGAIWEKYYNYPDKAQLGPVASDEEEAATQYGKTTGRYTKFETGTIHWISNKDNDNLGQPKRGESFVTYGSLDDAYTKMRGTYSYLGFPIMDQETTVEGYGYCEFEGGYIAWDDVEKSYKSFKYSTGNLNIKTNLDSATFVVIGKANKYYASGRDWSATDVPIGYYSVYFKDVDGYFTPTPKMFSLTTSGFSYVAYYSDGNVVGQTIGPAVKTLKTHGGIVIPKEKFHNDVGSKIGEGAVIPIYVPEIIDNSNVIRENNDWKTIDKIGFTDTNFNLAGFFAGIPTNTESTDDLEKYDELNLGMYNIPAASGLSLGAGILYTALQNFEIQEYMIFIQEKDSEQYRAIIQHGRPNPRERFNNPVLISTDSSQIAKTFHLRDDKDYSLVYWFDQQHATNNCEGYLSMSETGTIIHTPIVYADDKIVINSKPKTWLSTYTEEVIYKGDIYTYIMQFKFNPTTNHDAFKKLVEAFYPITLRTKSGQIIGVESPVALQVYDSRGRVTGLTNEGIKEEINNSFYLGENETVIIFNANDNYTYKLVGLENGTYGFHVESFYDWINNTVFKTVDIPITAKQSHQYAIDWDTFSANKTGVSMQVEISLVSVTNLQSTNGINWINWTWINPIDSNFDHTEIYLHNIFQTNTSAEYFNATGLEPGTSYTISTRTVDTNGNVSNTWVNLTATTLSDSKSGGGGGGSSGGGGGGAGSAEDYANVAVKDVDTQYMRMNANVTYEFMREGNPIQSVSFYSLKNSGEITSTIEVLNNRSKLVNSTPEGSIYKYVNIWVGKSGFATAANIKDAKVKFKVNSSWLEEMGVSPADVKLQRHNGTAWEVLPTTLINNTSGYATFEAQTPSFSPFAITAEKMLASSTSDNIETNPTPAEDVGMSGTQPEKTPGFGFSMAILIVGVFAGGYMYLKRRQN